MGSIDIHQNSQVDPGVGFTEDSLSFSPKFDLSAYRKFTGITTDKSVTYLNSSYQQPMNIRVKQALDEYLDQAFRHPHPKAVWQETAAKARERLARYLNVQETDLAFTCDTTEGLNLFQRAVPFRSGDNIVILDVEHPNHVYGWFGLAEQGLEVRRVLTNKETFANAATFASYIDARTVAIGLSSIMFHTGQSNDIKDICAQFRPRGIHILVDLTQHVGVAPIDLADWGVSAAAFSCHKGLGCPTGLGVLYIDPSVLPSLLKTPAIVGAGSIANLPGSLVADPDVQYHGTVGRFQHLNFSLVSAVALNASLKFILEEMGIEKVEKHLRALGRELGLRCADIGVEVVGSKLAAQRAPHLYVLKLLHPEWQIHLQKQGVYVSHYRCGVRISLAYFNDLGDIDALIRAIQAGRAAGIPLH